MKKFYLALIIGFLFLPSIASAQCGYQILAGITGGYQFESYNPKGLNNYISVYNSRRTNTLTKKMGEFGKLSGFYIGTRPLGFLMDEIIYFHSDFSISFLSETNEAMAGSDTREYKVSVVNKNFGFGTALYFSDFLVYNLINLNLTLSSVTLKNSLTSATSGNSSQELKNDSQSFGISFETGPEIYFSDFVMFEAAVGYHYWTQGAMKFSNGASLQVSEADNSPMSNFIDGGGFTFRAGFMLRTNIMGCFSY